MGRRDRVVLKAVRIIAALSAATVPAVLFGSVVLAEAPAQAAACSTTTSAAGCTVSTSIAVSQGTIEVLAPASLSWSFVLNGYDQWESASATPLSSCAGSGSGTACSGGTMPTLEVNDATGTGAGWALSAYLSSPDLPSNSVLTFDGTGSPTIGDSTDASLSHDPFSPTTPAGECDYLANGCTTPTPASSCSHAAIGFSSCPTYPVQMPTSSGPTSQVDLYSAAAATGEGAVCFSSGSPTAVGCVGAVPDDYFNLGVPAYTTAASDTSTVIDLTASSGP